MLKQVLQEIEAADGPVSIDELGRKLGLERSALTGMIDFWVRKGRLRLEHQPGGSASNICTSGGCRSTCAGPEVCPFVVKMPRTYTLTLLDRTGD